MFRKLLLVAAGVAAGMSLASAHVTLENSEAPVGSSYKAVMRVNHGCDGSPTVSVRVRMPPGVVAVKPMPKAGWKLDTVSGKYAKPASLNGSSINEGVTELSWSGGKLPDGYYDEFVFQSSFADELKPGTTIYFPVVQECEKGVHRWIEIPAGQQEHGGHGAAGSEPAPGLKLLPSRR
jgi:periplasmic copper chaperone A